MSTPKLSILLYHRIAGDKERKAHSVSVTKFRSQMAWLQATGHDVITMERAHRALFLDEPLKRRSVVITFDDGYSDFIDHAFPILQAFNYPAMVYVVAGLLGKPAAWLEEGDRDGDETIMDLEALRTIQQGGIEIGSHTLSHPLLHRLSPKACLDEIKESKCTLEDALGQTVDSFAYPYGVYNPEIEKMVVDAGYLTAASVNRGIANHAETAFTLPRKAISWGDNAIGFFHKLYLDNGFKRRPQQGLVNGHHY